jgi:Protein of unknown function (DUF2628)
MLTFTVHEPITPPADRVDRAESLLFVKDGFSWTAAVFAPIWLLASRLWLPLLGYLVVSAILQTARWLFAFDPSWMVLGTLALHLLVGLEAGALRQWSLQRRGWSNLGAVTGKSVAECERRFVEAWLPAQPIIAPRPNAGGAEPSQGGWWRKSPASARA